MVIYRSSLKLIQSNETRPSTVLSPKELFGKFFKMVEASESHKSFTPLPYIKGVTEPLTRVLKKHHITVVNKPLITFQQQFPATKFDHRWNRKHGSIDGIHVVHVYDIRHKRHEPGGKKVGIFLRRHIFSVGNRDESYVNQAVTENAFISLHMYNDNLHGFFAPLILVHSQADIAPAHDAEKYRSPRLEFSKRKNSSPLICFFFFNRVFK